MGNPSGLSPPVLPTTAATMEFADWTSLPADLINRIADCLLATSDLDYYMDFRAVCQSWRSATDDPKNTPDPRLRPRHWVNVEKSKTHLLLVNTTTGRVLLKELPLLRHYHIAVSTRDGLLILNDRESFNTVSVLNPFTGYWIRFIAPVPDEFVESATLLSGSSPTLVMLLCNKLYADIDPDGSLQDASRKVYMGDPSSESFVVYEEKDACPLIRLAARGIHTNGGSGSESPFPLAVAKRIFDLMRYFNVDLEMSDDEDTMMSEDEAAWNFWIGFGNRCFLLGSAGEILIIIRIKEGLEIYKMDTDRYTLEHVKNIGNRAIFLGGYCKCISVNADMFPSVDANCIYYIKGARLSDGFDMYGDTMYKDIHMYNLPRRRETRISEDKEYDSPPYTIIQLLSGSLTGW
ncbi:unnamed protein product [Alopecurus aequalis]